MAMLKTSIGKLGTSRWITQRIEQDFVNSQDFYSNILGLLRRGCGLKLDEL